MSGEVETTVITQEDLKQGLTQRHVMMIAIGGAIGVGLFLGAGKAIQQAGPALIAVYAITGVFIFIIMRALGELLLYKPVSGSFAEYAREFFGPLYGFITGWGYWVTWTVIGMAELTAAGIYIHYWFPSIPQYLSALVFLVLLVLLNLAAVGAFGEAEFWFASIKVLTILALVIGGTVVMVFGVGKAGQEGTIVNLWDHGGVAPNGLFAVLLTFQIVVFAYQGVELVGMTAAETKNPGKVLPRAVNSIPARIGVFYVGSLLVLLSLFPWTEFSKDTSPFVQAFAQIGVPAAGALMNFVVLTAALSSCSSGLYSNGRLLHRLSKDGLAPSKAGKISGTGVPAVGVLASGAVMLIGVGVNYVVPEKAFSYITSVATLGAIWSWGIIVACHLVYRRRVASGQAKPSPFRLPMATAACWAVLGFLAFVTVLLAFDEANRVALYSIPLWALIFIGGYFGFGKRGMRRVEMERTQQSVG
ncbi:amino acid permease [Pseudonocardia eucalypti]|uniref:Amino acid permease n=1 Tax=Pseudonocardia eucalypti TaxID=648755 RepID=A0ABP9R9L2_9PSEU|nr:AAT family amino acid transporter/D-serine/D-alanine/glycine transporter [Pseudonocardia eucalypti]